VEFYFIFLQHKGWTQSGPDFIKAPLADHSVIKLAETSALEL
jgi:hypothetical protein